MKIQDVKDIVKANPIGTKFIFSGKRYDKIVENEECFLIPVYNVLYLLNDKWSGATPLPNEIEYAKKYGKKYCLVCYNSYEYDCITSLSVKQEQNETVVSASEEPQEEIAISKENAIEMLELNGDIIISAEKYGFIKLSELPGMKEIKQYIKNSQPSVSSKEWKEIEEEFEEKFIFNGILSTADSITGTAILIDFFKSHFLSLQQRANDAIHKANKQYKDSERECLRLQIEKNKGE